MGLLKKRYQQAIGLGLLLVLIMAYKNNDNGYKTQGNTNKVVNWIGRSNGEYLRDGFFIF